MAPVGFEELQRVEGLMTRREGVAVLKVEGCESRVLQVSAEGGTQAREVHVDCLRETVKGKNRTSETGVTWKGSGSSVIASSWFLSPPSVFYPLGKRSL